MKIQTGSEFGTFHVDTVAPSGGYDVSDFIDTILYTNASAGINLYTLPDATSTVKQVIQPNTLVGYVFGYVQRPEGYYLEITDGKDGNDLGWVTFDVSKIDMTTAAQQGVKSVKQKIQAEADKNNPPKSFLDYLQTDLGILAAIVVLLLLVYAYKTYKE